MQPRQIGRIGNVVLVEFETGLYLDVDPPSTQQRAEGWRNTLNQVEVEVLAGALKGWSESLERRKI